MWNGSFPREARKWGAAVSVQRQTCSSTSVAPGSGWFNQSVSNPPVFWASGISWRLHQLYYYCYFCKKLSVPLKGLRTALSYSGGKGDTWDKGCGWEHLRGGLTQLAPFQQALCHLFFNSVDGRYVCALSPWYGQEPLLARTYPLGIF